MPRHVRAAITGRVTDVFAHRFVIETPSGARILADLGPKGAELFTLASGIDVTAEGEMKPSELKVDRISAQGDTPIIVPHKPKPHKHRGPNPGASAGGADAKPDVAVTAVRAAGFEPLAAPRRKPKHFEILARAGRDLVECHVEFGGYIRKQKIVAPDDPKWADDLRSAA